MQRDMLADHFGPDARILDLVGRHAGPLVGRDVAHAIAAGLHAVHADAGEVGHGVRQFVELDPVELDVLPRGEVAVAAIVAARDMGEHAHLLGRQRAVGDGDAQHIGVKLQIDAVHQPQRLEFLLGQLAGQAARDLIAEFGDALGDQRPVECVVDVHGRLRASSALDAEGHRQLDGWTAEPNELAQISRPHVAAGRELDRRHIGADRAQVVGGRGVDQDAGAGSSWSRPRRRRDGWSSRRRRGDRPRRRRRRGWRSPRPAR